MQEGVTSPAEIPGSARLERMLAATRESAIGAGAAAVWDFDPTKTGFFPVCPLYSLTGFACPGCGLTRGFHALFHGDILTALDYNALLPFFALLIGFGFVSLVFFALKRRRTRLSLRYPTAP